MTLLLGVDVGTSATKAVVIDSAGRIVAHAERPVELVSPQPGWAEEDPGQWWDNVCSLCRELPTGGVEAVGVSGMVPAVVLLDGTGRPLRRSIQQNDARASGEVQDLRVALRRARVLDRTGSAVTQQSVGPTARWLADHEPEVWRDTRTLLGSYDYVTYRLTGSLGVERNWALEIGHGRGHLFRAVLESTAYGFRHHLDVFAERGRVPRRVRVTNGGARSELWKQVVADVTGCALETLALQGGSELGAAFAAGIGVGAFGSWDEIERFVDVVETIRPDAAAHARYDELYPAYRKLQPALEPVLSVVRRAGDSREA